MDKAKVNYCTSIWHLTISIAKSGTCPVIPKIVVFRYLSCPARSIKVMTYERTKTKPLLLDSLSIIAPFVLYCQSVPALKKVTNIKVKFSAFPSVNEKKEEDRTTTNLWRLLAYPGPIKSSSWDTNIQIYQTSILINQLKLTVLESTAKLS